MAESAKKRLGQLALDSSRPAVFVSLRAPQYLFNLLSRDGWAQDRISVVAATLIAAGIDTLIARQMHKTNRALLGARIPLDLLYVCLAALAVPPNWPYSGVLLLLAPTAIELIATRGLLPGSAFVVVADTLMYFSRILVGANPYLFELLFYGVWMLVAGTAAFAILEVVGRQHENRFLAERQAYRSFILLETKNEFLLGRGGAVTEALNRVWQQLELGLGPVARAACQEFRKQQEGLAANTRREARYLADVLIEFAADQRRYEPVVARHLHLLTERQYGLLVLTPRQAETLIAQIQSLSLHGRRKVEVVTCDQITGEILMRLGTVSLHVPPARGRRLALVPSAVILSSLSLLALANPIYAALPVFPVVGMAICTAVLGLTAEKSRQRNAKGGLYYLWLATLFPAAAALSLSMTSSTQWELSDGRVIIPAIVGLTASLYMGGILWPLVSWPMRLTTIAGYVVWYILAININPLGAPPWRSTVGGLLIPASVVLTMLWFDVKNRDLGLRLHDQWVTDLQSRANHFRRRYGLQELLLLQQEVEKAEVMVQASTPNDHISAASTHLQEARLQLRAIRVKGSWSTSTIGDLPSNG